MCVRIVLSLILTSFIFGQEYSEDYGIKDGEVKIYIAGNEYKLEILINNTIITKSRAVGKKGIDESWLTDLDEDDNPEIAIFYYDENSLGHFDLYEINNLEVMNYQTPPFTDYENKYYRGNNTFDIDDELIILEYDAFNTDDKACCPTAGKMIVSYQLKNDELLVKQSVLQETSASIDRKENTTILIVEEAIGLPKLDKSSKTDCWMEIYVGEKKIGKTRKIKDNNNPKFNKSFEIIGYDNEPVKIVLYDSDGKKNQLIGEVKLIEALTGEYPILIETGSGNTESRGVLKIKYIDD